MSISKALTFPFKDSNWIRKIFVGSMVLFFGMPVLTLGIPLLLGWIIQIGRGVWYGLETPMPNWKKASAFFIEGLKLWIANLFWFFLTTIMALGVTYLVFSRLYSECRSHESECAFVIVVVYIVPIMIIALLFLMLLWPLQLSIAIRTGSLVQMLNPLAAFAILRKNVKGFLLAWFGGILCTSQLVVTAVVPILLFYSTSLHPDSQIGFFLFFIAAVVFMFLLVGLFIYKMVVTSHLFGQVLESEFDPHS